MDLYHTSIEDGLIIERELERLDVDKNFVISVDSYPYYCPGKPKCYTVVKDGKLVGVMLLCRNKNGRLIKDDIFHETRHAKQYYEKGKEYVENICPSYTEIDAHLYSFKRSLEEKAKDMERKVKEKLRFRPVFLQASFWPCPNQP
jgi:antitoxin component YwqK of YwqJK toxin-antitoxin module